ncbi:CAP domain-containing protein [Metallosphaera hakonensis]|uniref:CAP domain-containing protein n=1 Tax=Metallosphaera hakonensis TaxID=79601 RepID=UPI0006D144AB|nr:CAP domain-containing protein [Metallosphaera hakonensis]
MFFREILDFVNELRSKHGVPPVRYASTGVAQFRAEYMLRERLFSHYDREGIPPFYYFARFGNPFYAEEAIGYVQSNHIQGRGLEMLRKVIIDMVYHDEESGWGHRDTLLDPCFNYGDVGVAMDNNHIYLDITMVSAWIHWSFPPSVRGNVFTAEGKVYTMVPSQVLIYDSVVDRSNVNRHYYDLGNLKAMVLPPNYYAKDVDVIRPLTWSLTRDMKLKFPLPQGHLLSVLILGKDSRSFNWTPMSNKQRGLCGLLVHPVI